MPTGLLSELEFYLIGNYNIREEKKKIKKKYRRFSKKF